MKKINLLISMALVAALASCGSKNNEKETTTDTVVAQTIDTAAAVDTAVAPTQAEPIAEEVKAEPDHSANENVIRKVYKTFVFGYSESSPKKYFTPKALKKLEAAYEYDCDYGGPCYGYWALRTGAQDGNGSSNIKSITPIDGKEGWYRVEYSDMGHKGVTDIKIKDGKIDDYKRISAVEKW